MSKFKIGDIVYSKEFGIGKVIPYPSKRSIAAQFQDDYYYYSNEGKFHTYSIEDTSSRDITKANFFRKLLYKLSGAKL